MPEARRVAAASAYLCAALGAASDVIATGEWGHSFFAWAFLGVAWFVVERKGRAFPSWASGLLAIPIGIYGFLDFWKGGSPLMTVMLHVLSLLLVAKATKEKTAADLWTIFVISLLLMLIGALISFDVRFFALMVAWSAAAMFFFNAVLLMPRKAGAVAVTAGRSTVWRRTVAQTATTWFAVAAGMGATFLFLPRDLRGLRDTLGIRTGVDSGGWRLGVMPPNSRPDAPSGFSETIEVGAIGRVILDPSIALRVRIQEGNRTVHKPEGQVYLTGTKLADFDGRRWSTGGPYLDPPQRLVGQRIDVFVEKITERSTATFHISPKLRGADASRLQYRVPCLWRPWDGKTLTKAAAIEGPLVELPDTLALPRYRALAEQITKDARDDFERAQAIETWLATKYDYTLDLEWETNGDPVAEFLFVRKRGYCVYFASAMAVLLRALPDPIPCRMIAGYAQGTWDESTQTYTFQRRDAHAWVEAYFVDPAARSATVEVPFDPTAPQREDLIASGGDEPDAWSMFRLQIETALLSYDSRRQREVVLSIADIALWLSTTLPGIAILVLLGIAVLVLSRLRRKHRKAAEEQVLQVLARGLAIPTRPTVAFYAELLMLLSKRGLKRLPSQTPEEFAKASKRAEVDRVTDAYLRLRFAGVALTADDLAGVRRDLDTLR